MGLFSIAIMFMSLLFSIVMMLFIIISVLLIYSLLMVSVETKTFEIGVTRMLGMNGTGIIMSVLIQAIMFVLPSIMVGFMVAIPVLKAIFYFLFFKKLNMDLNSFPTTTAIANALIVGIFIPLISALLPIRTALSQNLNESLDYSRSRTKATIMKIVHKGNGSSVLSLFIGGISVAYGMSVYYLLPYALLSFNLGLIMQIFFLILFGMLFGLVLLSLNA